MIETVSSTCLQVTPSQQWRWFVFDQLWFGCQQQAGEYSVEYCHALPSSNHAIAQFGAVTRRRVLENDGYLQLQPRLADRSVVAKPRIPMVLRPDARVQVMVGTALWLQFNWSEYTIFDLPCARLSDTWFGPNSRAGELCYAAQTNLRLASDADTLPAYKAYTPIEIINKTNSNLTVDSINLPVDYLTLYCDGKTYWTTAVQLIGEADTQTSKVVLQDHFPKTLIPAKTSALTEVSPPRKQVEGNVIYKAASWLFS